MTYQDAIDYFNQAEKYGYYHPEPEEIEAMTQEEVIKVAEHLGQKGDFEMEANE